MTVASRSRNIKPGFFTNDDLVECGFATRLLFAGLWTLADKEGRLEDRPKKIKLAIFPADDLDVDLMLQQLHDRRFILRYRVKVVPYIQIVSWNKHQRPHHTERASTIPPPDQESVLTQTLMDSREVDTSELTVKHPLENGECQCDNHQNLPDSLLLIPDSLLLIPDSLSITSAIAPVKEGVPPKKYPTSNFDPMAELAKLGIEPQLAADWIALRRTKHATVTRTALTQMVREAGKAGMTLPDVLTECCARGWAGFKASWSLDDVNANRGNGRARTSAEPAWRVREREWLQQVAPGAAARSPGDTVVIEADEVRKC